MESGMVHKAGLTAYMQTFIRPPQTSTFQLYNKATAEYILLEWK